MGFFDDNILTRAREYVSNFPGVIRCEVSKERRFEQRTENSWAGWTDIVIKLWIKKDIFDSYNVMLKLNGDNDFQKVIKILCDKGSTTHPRYEIHEIDECFLDGDSL